MSTESELSGIDAEISLKRELRRTKLLEKAKGRGLWSWVDFVYFLPAVFLSYVAFTGGDHLNRENLALMVAIIMIIQWSVMRLYLRVNALVEYLTKHPLMQESRHDAQVDTEKRRG